MNAVYLEPVMPPMGMKPELEIREDCQSKYLVTSRSRERERKKKGRKGEGEGAKHGWQFMPNGWYLYLTKCIH